MCGVGGGGCLDILSSCPSSLFYFFSERLLIQNEIMSQKAIKPACPNIMGKYDQCNGDLMNLPSLT